MPALHTPWTERVDPDHPLPEYPRPQLVRKHWLNLNGQWDYAITPLQQAQAPTFEGKITVPFPVESYLSGVQRPLLPDQRLWYRRKFTLPAEWASQHILLHFGAVDWKCEVRVNGKFAGEHTGGFLPFSFDITHLLQEGINELVVLVDDPTHTQLGECGKQTLKPRGIWYTAVSGIWQTVWLEPVPETCIASVRVSADLDTGTVAVSVDLQGPEPGVEIHAAVLAGGTEIAGGHFQAGKRLSLSIPSPILWSPERPFLYDLSLRLVKGGQQIDEAASYFAIRKYSLEPDHQGHLRFCLNGKPIFLYGPLDQGYYPDGLYTPATEEAMLYDIEYTRQMGCNMIRKHVKVEPARWYYHCDRLGMIVWQDMPNGGLPVGGLLSFLTIMLGLRRSDRSRLRRAGRADAHNRRRFSDSLKEMIDHLGFFPCIAVWVPFNEGWGQFEARQSAGWVKAYDPTRLVDHASGWFEQGGGDFKSTHVYFRKLYSPKKEARRAFVISEFGGYSLKTTGHVWDEKKKFGYRFYNTPAELTSAYLRLLEDELQPLIPQGLAAAVYTQTTDVETEINGYLTYDRRVEKMDTQSIYRAHCRLLEVATKSFHP